MARQFVFFGRSSSLLMLIFYKLLLAVVEVLAGGLCLIGAFFVKHASLADAISRTSTGDNLDRSVNWIIHWLVTSNIDYPLIQQIGIILIAFGLFNVLLAVGVWFKSHKMRIVALVVFGALTLYGVYELVENISALNIISVLMDLIIFYYFWKVLPRHLEN